MRLKISAFLNPDGFSDPDVVGVQFETSLPELANFRSGESLSEDDVEAVRNRVHAGLAELAEKVDADLSVLSNLARERAAAAASRPAAPIS